MKKGLIVLGGLALLLVGCAGDSRTGEGGQAAPILTLGPIGNMLDGSAAVVKPKVVNGAPGLTVVLSAKKGIVDADGTYIAPLDAGTDTVSAYIAEFPGVRAETSVNVRKITVAADPKSVQVSPGELVRLTATATGGRPGEDGILWNPKAGTVDSQGIYTAPTMEGIYIVTAQSAADPRKKDDVVVKVGAQPIVYVQPSTLRVGYKETYKLQAITYGLGSKEVLWATDGGKIDPDGTFTASEVGRWRVTATSKSNPLLYGTAVIEVTTVPAGIKVYVQPNPGVCKPGGTIQFQAIVTGTDNKTVYWNANGGTITPDGLFTAAGKPGTVVVTATSVVNPEAQGVSSALVVE